MASSMKVERIEGSGSGKFCVSRSFACLFPAKGSCSSRSRRRGKSSRLQDPVWEVSRRQARHAALCFGA